MYNGAVSARTVARTRPVVLGTVPGSCSQCKTSPLMTINIFGLARALTFIVNEEEDKSLINNNFHSYCVPMSAAHVASIQVPYTIKCRG